MLPLSDLYLSRLWVWMVITLQPLAQQLNQLLRLELQPDLKGEYAMAKKERRRRDINLLCWEEEAARTGVAVVAAWACLPRLGAGAGAGAFLVGSVPISLDDSDALSEILISMCSRSEEEVGLLAFWLLALALPLRVMKKKRLNLRGFESDWVPVLYEKKECFRDIYLLDHDWTWKRNLVMLVKEGILNQVNQLVSQGKAINSERTIVDYKLCEHHLSNRDSEMSAQRFQKASWMDQSYLSQIWKIEGLCSMCWRWRENNNFGEIRIIGCKCCG